MMLESFVELLDFQLIQQKEKNSIILIFSYLKINIDAADDVRSKSLLMLKADTTPKNMSAFVMY